MEERIDNFFVSIGNLVMMSTYSSEGKKALKDAMMTEILETIHEKIYPLRLMEMYIKL